MVPLAIKTYTIRDRYGVRTFPAATDEEAIELFRLRSNKVGAGELWLGASLLAKGGQESGYMGRVGASGSAGSSGSMVLWDEYRRSDGKVETLTADVYEEET